MICSDEQFSFQITTERGWKVAVACDSGREFHVDGPATFAERTVHVDVVRYFILVLFVLNRTF